MGTPFTFKVLHILVYWMSRLGLSLAGINQSIKRGERSTAEKGYGLPND